MTASQLRRSNKRLDRFAAIAARRAKRDDDCSIKLRRTKTRKGKTLDEEQTSKKVDQRPSLPIRQASRPLSFMMMKLPAEEDESDLELGQPQPQRILTTAATRKGRKRRRQQQLSLGALLVILSVVLFSFFVIKQQQQQEVKRYHQRGLVMVVESSDSSEYANLRKRENSGDASPPT